MKTVPHLDLKYHQRYHLKPEKRAKLLNRLFPQMETMLDIGCNSGAVSLELLNLNSRLRIIGIDLDSRIVLPNLLEHNRFEFLETELTPDTVLPSADVVHYSAVHHHIVHKQGLVAATRIFSNLLATAENLVFETGMLTEAGDFSWQNSLRSYFSSDEEHLHFLVSHTQSAIRSFCKEDTFYIHLATRPLIHFLSKQAKQRDICIDQSARKLKLPIQQKPVGKSLISAEDYLWYARDNCYFYKIRPYFQVLSELESEIGRQIKSTNALKSRLTSPGHLSTNLVRASQLTKISAIKNQKLIAHALISWIKELETTEIDLSRYETSIYGNQISAIDLIEVSGRNILIEETTQQTIFIDFEPFSNNNRWRNYLRSASLLLKLGAFYHSAKYLFLSLAYYMALMLTRYSLEQRIVDKRPSGFGVLHSLINRVISGAWRRFQNAVK